MFSMLGKRTLHVITFLICSVAAYSQGTVTATLLGTITDPSGAAVSGASVRIQHVETNQNRTAQTNVNGGYEFSFLPVGSYTLTVQAPGFQQATVKPFDLAVGQTQRVDLNLTVGSVNEAVTVEASTVGLQTETATLGTVIDRQKVAELPLNGRSFVQLALLAPGVNPVTPGSLSARSAGGSLGQSAGMNVNGARDNQNRYYYDGVETMSLGSYSFSFSLSVDAIQEFKVETNAYSAELGGAPGGHINLTTKSGVNAYHGQLWEFNRNDKLTTLAPFTPYSPDAKPPRLNRNQFGGNFGGPIIIPKLYNGKNKTFFFFNWELGRLVSGTSGSRLYVPPSEYRNGDFSSFSSPIFDPQTGQPFPGNRIPANRISSITSGYMKYVPSPNFSDSGFNFLGPLASAPTKQNQYLIRIDHQISAANSIYGTYIQNYQETNSVPAFSFDTTGSQIPSYVGSLTDTHVFSSTMVNEARFGWHRRKSHQFFGTTNRPDLNIANELNIPGVSTDARNFGPPTFSNSGYDLPTVRSIGPADQHNQIWQFSDNFSWRKGNHSIKFGALIFRRNFSFDEAFNPRGTFTFDGRITSGGITPVREHAFASYLLGLVTDAAISADPFANRMNHFWQSYYVQDDWKIHPSLTINFGLRYEYFQPPVERGKLTNFELNGPVPGFTVNRQLYSGFPASDNLPDSPGYPKGSLIYPDRNNFGPRFGFAWKVPKISGTVIRGGYGMFYTQEISNSFTVLTLNPPIVKNTTFSSTFTQPQRVETVFLGQGQSISGQFGTSSVDPHLRDAYIHQWNFSIQKQLASNTYFDAAYVGTKGTNLVIGFDANRPINTVVPGSGVAPIAQRRPYQGAAGMTLAKSIGNSTYHALQLRGERRTSRGLSFITSYTWSKALSSGDQSTVGGGGFSAGVQDIYNLAGEKSPAAFDLRHRLSIALVYDLPFFRSASNGFVRTALGGWQTSTIITAQTGFASALNGWGDTTGTGISSRLDMVEGQNPNLSRSIRSRDRWFNTDAFQAPQPGQFGNAARHPIYLPGLINFDVVASKNFRFLEQHNLQFRAEMFNFFNHVNLGAPGLNIQAPNTFGRILTSSQAAGHESGQRIIQLALKYSF